MYFVWKYCIAWFLWQHGVLLRQRGTLCKIVTVKRQTFTWMVPVWNQLCGTFGFCPDSRISDRRLLTQKAVVLELGILIKVLMAGCIKISWHHISWINTWCFFCVCLYRLWWWFFHYWYLCFCLKLSTPVILIWDG